MTHALNRQTGLSIIEIMVALVLSLILTLGLVQIFTANSQSFRLAEASSRIQESGRMSLGILSREIRNADYWGCLSDLANLNSVLNNVGDVGALLRRLDAEDGTGPGGSDRLWLGGAGGGSEANVVFDPAAPAATMTVDDSSTLFRGDIVIISNCKSGDIFQVTNDPGSTGSLQVNYNTGGAQGPPGNSTSTLSRQYSDEPEGGALFRPRQQRYYLSEVGGDRELVTDGVNVTGGTANVGSFSAQQALVGDVRDFQLQFGRDTSGNGQINVWEDPLGLNAAGNLQADEAIAVRMSLLIRSPRDNLTDGGQTYCYPGWLDCEGTPGLLSAAAAGDTFLYRVYTTTVSLRNRN